MSCDVDKATKGLENELWRRWRDGKVGEWTLLILQPFRHFNITAHSPTLLSPYLCHSSFSNCSVASPTSQLIPQSFFSFSYVTGSSLMWPGELPMIHNIIDNFFYSCYMRRLKYFWNLGYLLSSPAWSHTNRLKINAGRFSLLTKQTITRSHSWTNVTEQTGNFWSETELEIKEKYPCFGFLFHSHYFYGVYRFSIHWTPVWRQTNIEPQFWSCIYKVY